MMLADTPQQPIRIAVSSCLLGQEVRYDGGHKHNAYLTQSLGEYFEFIPYCPEMAIGLGVPRPPIRLVVGKDGPRAVGVDDPDRDVTTALQNYASEVVLKLDQVSGYLFKKNSPSCGMERVKIYSNQGVPVNVGSGIFAHTIMQRLPALPVEEEGRLMDPVLRENFIERVFIYYRWQRLLAKGISAAALVEFHACHKFNLLAHDTECYGELGRLVATAGKGDISDLAQQYIAMMMQGLKRRASRKRHTNVLQHMMGFLKQHLDSQDKAELLDIIDAYRLGQVPLIVPLTLLKHHLRRHPNDYINQQYYLNPHPRELMLRNHI